jgi:hypothetical protein
MFRPLKRSRADEHEKIRKMQVIMEVPYDVWSIVVAFLSDVDLASLRGVSATLKRFVDKTGEWRKRLHRCTQCTREGNFENSYFTKVRFFSSKVLESNRDEECGDIKDLMKGVGLFRMCFMKRVVKILKDRKHCNLKGRQNALENVIQFLEKQGMYQFLAQWMFTFARLHHVSFDKKQDLLKRGINLRMVAKVWKKTSWFFDASFAKEDAAYTVCTKLNRSSSNFHHHKLSVKFRCDGLINVHYDCLREPCRYRFVSQKECLDDAISSLEIVLFLYETPFFMDKLVGFNLFHPWVYLNAFQSSFFL